MQLVTWNINGLEDHYLDERTEAAMFQLLLGAPIEKAILAGFTPISPDIVVLQEVVPRTFNAHITPHLKAAGFTIYPTEPSERSYFEVVASRLPIVDSSYTPFNYSDQGRGLTSFTVSDKGKLVHIMTAHLESMKPGSSMRLDQSNFIIDRVNQQKHASIFAGDTNLRKKEWLTLNSSNVDDAWEAAGSNKKHKSTWFSDHRKARYDRVWTRGIHINHFETFGKHTIPHIKQPASDHLAVRVSFDVSN